MNTRILSLLSAGLLFFATACSNEKVEETTTTTTEQSGTMPADNTAPAPATGTDQANPQMAPQPMPNMQAPPPQTTAPGFSGKPNPAHGEPGHRCDLQVGATLP